jgi:predicted ATPase
MSATRLKKLCIVNFRALHEVNIEFGNRITVICGKNGTAKSSILGIAAQIFNFEKNYQTGVEINFSTITGVNFKSKFADHFRFSSKYDTPGSIDVKIELFDGYTNNNATCELSLSTRQNIAPRPVVRNNSTTGNSNRSRNFTHPVIYLSLQRLLPITLRSRYAARNFEYLNANRDEFISLNNELLNKQSSNATGTGGSIYSAVSHGNNYDQDSVSAGEDNAGQIIMALMSFKKLKQEYADYRGGLLLIDEADAGLFPAAQTKLISILDRYAKSLDLQIIMTSHSPTMIEKVYDLNTQYPKQKNYKTVYLSDTFGSVQALDNFSWLQIYADLHIETVPTASGDSIPKVNLYFEDAEGADFFKNLMFRAPCKKYTEMKTEVTLGCGNYSNLLNAKVPEFALKSIIILDGDIPSAIKKFDTVLTLPGSLPPDQLIFEFLYNLPPDDSFWINNIQFTKAVLRNIASEIISTLHINTESIDLKDLITAYQQDLVTKGIEPSKKLRNIFKAFYKNQQFQLLLTLSGFNHPWKKWINDNKVLADKFKISFNSKLIDVLTKGWGVERSKIPFSP